MFLNRQGVAVSVTMSEDTCYPPT